MSKRPPVHLRLEILYTKDGVPKAAWTAASASDASIMRERNYRPGDMTRADMGNPRNPEFHRLVHALGSLLTQNLDDFEGMTAHQALKELQLLSGIECEKRAIEVPGFGKCMWVQPESVSYENMDQTRFYQMVRELCGYIAKEYWPQCSPEEVEQMIELMPLGSA